MSPQERQPDAGDTDMVDRRVIGRARIKDGVRPYGGKWANVYWIRGDDVGVYVPGKPALRIYRQDEFSQFMMDGGPKPEEDHGMEASGPKP